MTDQPGPTTWSGSPRAEVIEFYAADRATRVFGCACGWNGTIKQMSYSLHRELMDHSCPSCDKMLVIRPYPDISETRKAAADGDEEAIRALPSVEQTVKRQERAEATELKTVGQLPQLDLSTPTLFIWDFEQVDGESWSVIRVARSGTEVWRELAYWEGWERAIAIRDLLATRYGDAFAGLARTLRSGTYLKGDDFSAVDLPVADASDTPWLTDPDLDRERDARDR